SPRVVLDRRPPRRSALWHDTADPDGFLIAATAGNTVWVWRENSADRNASGWISFGSLPTIATSPTTPIADLVYLEDTSTLFALRGGQLSSRKWPDGTQWTAIETKDGSDSVVLHALAPVLVESGGLLVTSAAKGGMVGVSNDSLYTVTPAGVCSKRSPIDVTPNVLPVAV